ncbi:hypothetical protein [Microcella pacifica]|uniref:Uncharacterized protein n=1 Tax=Microcella pacifica TaxID=2591847 RepID=A0A9E5JMH6_9MICO|nr:hypothetical protein [Microcella pacifica]NHF62235.1 hypothetical protein [Microcella pacifica]
MAHFRNVSPIGALDIPALGRIVQAGEVFEVTKQTEDFFDAQPGNFARVAEPKKGKSAKPAASVAPSGAGDTTDTPEGDEQKEESR